MLRNRFFNGAVTRSRAILSCSSYFVRLRYPCGRYSRCDPKARLPSPGAFAYRFCARCFVQLVRHYFGNGFEAAHESPWLPNSPGRSSISVAAERTVVTGSRESRAVGGTSGPGSRRQPAQVRSVTPPKMQSGSGLSQNKGSWREVSEEPTHGPPHRFKKPCSSNTP